MSIVLILAIAVFLLLFGGILWSFLKHSIRFTWFIFANSILGLISIYLLNVFGFGIPLTILTLLVAAIFGLLGVAVLAILAFFGMI